jgi:hypothetical protein
MEELFIEQLGAGLGANDRIQLAHRENANFADKKQIQLRRLHTTLEDEQIGSWLRLQWDHPERRSRKNCFSGVRP